MINKDKFYSEHMPDIKAKSRMWKNIERKTKPEKKLFFILHTMPGFYYGMAAAVVLFFTFYGVYSFGRNLLYDMKPEEIKLNKAYQSAINEFEKVVPAVNTGNYYERDLYSAKMEQLRQIETAILELRRETYNNDLTPLKQLHLRQLYVNKLKILLEIIEQGEINL